MSTATGEVKAGRAYVEILLDQTKLERGLKQAQQKIKSFGSSLTNMGKNLLACHHFSHTSSWWPYPPPKSLISPHYSLKGREDLS